MDSSMNRHFDIRFAAHIHVVVGSCVLLLAGAAQAQDRAETDNAGAEQSASEASEDPRVEQAREAFRLGSTLARQGQWRDALAAYQRSAELHPHAVTTYNIGYVERALGHLTLARRYLALALEPRTNSAVQPLPENLQSLARSYLSEIDRRIVRVSVTLTDPRLAVSADGRPFDVVSSGGRPLLAAGTAAPGRPTTPPAAAFDLMIDPGRHVFLLSLAGKGDTLHEHSFDSGSTPTLQLGIERESKPSAFETTQSASVPADKPVDSPASLRPWMWTAFAVGAAGVVAGSVLGILAIEKDAELENVCKPRTNCPLNKMDDKDRLDLYATGANIGFGVGILGAGVGTALWLLDRPAAEQPVPATRAAVRIDVGQSGVWVSGRF